MPRAACSKAKGLAKTEESFLCAVRGNILLGAYKVPRALMVR